MLENLWKQYLDEVIERKFSEIQISRTRPTFGVEHEFFLLGPNGALATGSESHEMFEYLSQQAGVRVHRDADSDRINQINFEHSESKSYSVLKYEFYPHLLEFAFGYSTRIDLLEQRIHEIFELVNRAVMRSNLKISDTAQIPIEEISSESLNALDAKRRTLHEGRKLRLINTGADAKAANFPAFTAGTQIQVGGTKWWENEGLISRLYLSEPTYLEQSFLSLYLPREAAKELMRERFKRYRSVYSTKKLLGFPSFENWTLTNWSKFLSLDLEMELPQNKSEVSLLAAKVHDLSLIAVKPNMATLEFRGCPSLPNCGQIVLELRRRQKQFLDAMDSYGNPNLSESRESFERLIAGNRTSHGPMVKKNGS